MLNVMNGMDELVDDEWHGEVGSDENDDDDVIMA